jgi:hypothetical protein
MRPGLHVVLVRGPAGGAPDTPAGYAYRVADRERRAWVVGLRPEAATVQAVATCLGLLVVDRASGAIPAPADGPAPGLLLRDGRAAPGVERVPAGHPLRRARLEQYLAPEPPLASLLRDFRGGR